jgi:hypothetical protein
MLYETTHPKEGTVRKDDKNVRIEIKSGVVVDVSGLPRGYTYEVIDHDADETCDLCYEGNCPHSCHAKQDRRERGW